MKLKWCDYGPKLLHFIVLCKLPLAEDDWITSHKVSVYCMLRVLQKTLEARQDRADVVDSITMILLFTRKDSFF